MNKSDEINELADALSKLQGEVHNAFKDRVGHKCKYADLGSILDIARPLLCKYSLSVTQLCGSANAGSAEVETVLMHKSGQWISSIIQMGVEKGSMSMAQAVGSVITYARRYSLAAILGIAQTDDDANVKESYEEPRETLKLSYKQQLIDMIKGDEGYTSRLKSHFEKEGLNWKTISDDDCRILATRLHIGEI